MNETPKTDTTTVEEPVDAEGTDAPATDSKEPAESTPADPPAQPVDINYDEEIAKERKGKGKPDPKKAWDAKVERTKKRDTTDEADETASEDDLDRPLTARDIAKIRSEERAAANADRALEIAREFAETDKEAELIVEKWMNRTFPDHLPIRDQVQEMFGAVHAKRLIGQNHELKRALKGKDTVNRNPAQAHIDPPVPGEPSLPEADRQGILAAGFSYNAKHRRYEKALKNGTILVRDPKTKQVIQVKPSK